MPVAEQFSRDEEQAGSVERMILSDEPLIAVEVRQIVRRQKDHVVLAGVEVAIGSIRHVRPRQGDTTLGPEVRNHELVTFSGLGLRQGGVLSK